MEYKEVNRDLFDIDFKEYTPAHCISADCKMGAGIAVPMKKKFSLGNLHKSVDNYLLTPGQCIYHNGVYNLITKKKYWHKPTYDTMAKALTSMKVHAEQNNIEKIAMPKIGAGLDKLSWPKVRELIEEIFNDTKAKILVCSI